MSADVMPIDTIPVQPVVNRPLGCAELGRDLSGSAPGLVERHDMRVLVLGEPHWPGNNGAACSLDVLRRSAVTEVADLLGLCC